MGTGATRDSLRRHNLSMVLQRVHRRGPQSRAALTQATGLNRSTVGGLVAELEELGLVEEGEPESTGTAGRPSPMVRAIADHVVVLAAEVAAGGLDVAVGGLGGALSHRAHVPVEDEQRPHDDAIAELTAMLDRALDALTSRQHLVGVGVAAPGLVRSHDGYVHLAPNLGWRDVPLGAAIAAHLHRRGHADVAVTVANEAHLGTRAEHLRGAGVGVDDLVYLSSEIGVGGGAVVGGRLQIGADGYSGEIGHLLLRTDDGAATCRCGNRGCVESETGALALLRLLGREHDRPVPEVVADVIASASDGDAAAADALREIGSRLGRAVASLVNLLNPRRVILGGWFADAVEWLEEGMAEPLQRHALGAPLDGLTIAPSGLGASSALIGAVEVALDPLLADPASSPVLLVRR